MGKLTRRGAAFSALALAGTLAIAPAAMADDISGPVNPSATSYAWQDQLPKLYRFAGEDRVSTAIQAAVRTQGNTWKATRNLKNPDNFKYWELNMVTSGHWTMDKVAIVATSSDFPDALAAAPLADALSAPVLLSPGGQAELDNRVIQYLDDAGYDRVILVGGHQIFGDSIVDALENGAMYKRHGDTPTTPKTQASPFKVERIEGANRYQTAIEVAKRTAIANAMNRDYTQGKVFGYAGSGLATNVFIADGQDYPDALAAGAAAAQNNGIVLLAKGKDGNLDSQTFAALSAKMNNAAPFNQFGKANASFIAVGGPAANAAAAGWQSDPIEVNFEVVGSDRYQTAIQLAQRYHKDAYNFVLASGENFPDGVVGGAYAANVDGPLLLTKSDRLPNSVLGYLQSQKQRMIDDHTAVPAVENPYMMGHVFVFGGFGSVSKAVSSTLNEDLVWKY